MPMSVAPSFSFAAAGSRPPSCPPWPALPSLLAPRSPREGGPAAPDPVGPPGNHVGRAHDAISAARPRQGRRQACASRAQTRGTSPPSAPGAGEATTTGVVDDARVCCVVSPLRIAVTKGARDPVTGHVSGTGCGCSHLPRDLLHLEP